MIALVDSENICFISPVQIDPGLRQQQQLRQIKGTGLQAQKVIAQQLVTSMAGVSHRHLQSYSPSPPPPCPHIHIQVKDVNPQAMTGKN